MYLDPIDTIYCERMKEPAFDPLPDQPDSTTEHTTASVVKNDAPATGSGGTDAALALRDCHNLEVSTQSREAVQFADTFVDEVRIKAVLLLLLMADLPIGVGSSIRK